MEHLAGPLPEDSGQPRGHVVASRVELCCGADRLEKHLGYHMGGVPGVAQHGVRERVQRAIVAVAQFGERVCVAPRHPLYQVSIRRQPARLLLRAHPRLKMTSPHQE